MNFQKLIDSINNGLIYDIDGVRLVQLLDCFSIEDLETIESIYRTEPEHKNTHWTTNKKDWPFDIHQDDKFYKNLLDAVNTKLNKNFDHYVGRVWQEENNPYMDPHVDNDMVCGSMQIYLPSSAGENTGTIFFGNNLTLQFKFKPNTGYICSDPTKILHSTGLPVNFSEYRRSAYFIFRDV
jgi:hypothetical protein